MPDVGRAVSASERIETRHEAEPDPETLTRNWNELLQELRVVQTGVQILTGFLLTVPFSNRFTSLSHGQRAVYLTILGGSVLCTALLLTPAACHRVLFRRGERPWLVTTAQRAAVAGMTMVALTMAGVVLLVFDVVAGWATGITAGAVALVLFVVLWALLPLSARVDDEPGTRRAP